MFSKYLTTVTRVLIIMGLFSFISYKSKESGADVIKRLDDLGYFKYAESDKVTALKDDLMKSYDKYGILSTVTDSKTLLPYDYRLYFCDGEALFESGGLESYLGFAKHAFEKRGLKFNWSDEVTNEKGNNLNHRVAVNGKEYVAFEGTTKRTNIWGVAQLNFYNMLNDQLEVQGSDERIYPISSGEEGYFVLLSKELFDYISTTFYQGKDIRKWDIPYPVGKWKEVHGLK